MDPTVKTPTLNRRTLLRNAGATAALSTAAIMAKPRISEGQEPVDPHAPAMRTQTALRTINTTDGPALAPLGVIVHNRMAFGPRAGDLAAFAQLGATDDERLTAYVEQQLNPGSINDSACDNLIAAQGFTTLDKSLTRLWQDHASGDVSWSDRMLPYEETERTTWLRAVYSRRQLVEVLADFWHNHFNIYARDGWTGPVWPHYDREVIRGNLLGNFRTMLGAVAKSPAMLYYLDNQNNTAAGPNENWARELFELHTMGAENYLGIVPDRNDVPLDEEGRPVGYIDKDVYQATECFTGWTTNRDTGQFLFVEGDHTPYEKIVLNQSIGDFLGQQDGEIVLDMLANHPGTARHIARKLCRRLISDEPPESVVQAAADVFYAHRESPNQLKRVVRTILLSQEFRTTWGEKVKRPFEYAANVLRATNAAFVPDGDFGWNYSRMGQPLFQWHPPDGYPDSRVAWTGTMPMLQRWKHANWLIDWEFKEGPNDGQKRLPIEQEMPANRRTPNQIVDYWSQRILGQALPPNERASVLDFLAEGRNPDFELPAEDIQERTRYMVALLMMTPSFLWK